MEFDFPATIEKENDVSNYLLGSDVKSEGSLASGEEVVIRDNVSSKGIYGPYKLQLFTVDGNDEYGNYFLRKGDKYLGRDGNLLGRYVYGKKYVSRRVLVRRTEAEEAGWLEGTSISNIESKKGEKMTQKESIQNRINRKQESIKKLKDEVELDLMRIKFMEENKLEELDEKVFQVCQVLQISTSSKETEYEKAVVIANILKNQ